jgi:hypothetical protein
MDWYCVRIPGKRSANAWMTLARTVYLEAGSPPDCFIHHEISPAGQNHLYFSPECEAVFPQLLKLFGATPCEKPEGVETLVQVLQRPTINYTGRAQEENSAVPTAR